MPNIKSAKKRVVITKVKTLQNKMFKSAFKTMMKKYEAAINAGDADTAKALYASVIKKVDQAAAKGIIHKNAADRKKSRYTNMLNGLSA
ncbi:MAG: 30S ribosomal protein S20 [Clostridia bacterium]|nr:30S ribosomal protein S20 [Clostridia bacterium]